MIEKGRKEVRAKERDVRGRGRACEGDGEMPGERESAREGEGEMPGEREARG